jgi:subtilisin family serine protease
MRVAASSILALLVLGSGALPVAGGESPNAAYVVQLRSLPDARSHYHGEPVESSNDALRFLVVRPGNPESFERRLQGDANVVAYEQDLELYRTLLTPTDPLYAGYQYDLKPSTTNIEAAWDVTLGSAATKVCVADTGQYRAHQDFVGVAWGEWKDLVAGKASPYDDNGHGTHVTGTIGAAMDNGRGVAGIAHVTIAGAKVLNRQGSGSVSGVANGISWCADIGSHIISLSLGGGYSSTIEAAVNYAAAKGALVVAAAGNSGPCSNCVDYPAKLPAAFAVACTDAANAQCSFSSEGPEVDIAAPGKDIASTYPPLGTCGRKNSNCYVLMSGTSMSTPHVAALAALVKSAHPELDADGIRSRLVATALDLGAAGTDQDFGAGLIQGSAVA